MNHKNIIFFDFDGVLSYWATYTDYDFNGTVNRTRCIENDRIRYINNQLRKSNVVAVFFPISSWADEFDTQEKIQQWLDKMKLSNFVPPETSPCYFTERDRARFVSKYVSEHNITNYVVLDDENDQEYTDWGVKHIKTHLHDGLTFENIQMLNGMIKSWV